MGQSVGWSGNDPRERRAAGLLSGDALGDGLELDGNGKVRLKLDPKSDLEITPQTRALARKAQKGGAVSLDGVELLIRKDRAGGYAGLDSSTQVLGSELGGASYGGTGVLVLTDTTPPSWVPVGAASVTVSQTDRLLGRDSPGAGAVEEIALGVSLEFTGALSIQRAALTGDVTAAANSNALLIPNDTVTYAKIQNVTDARVLGRAAGSAGDVQELSAGTGVTIAGGTISATGSGGTVTSVTGTAPIAVANPTTTPVVSLNDNGVTYAKMQDVSADNRLVGRIAGGGAGDPEEVRVGTSLEMNATDLIRSALTGDVTASAGGNATTIANDAVTYAKIQNVTDARVLGRAAGSSGDVQELSAGSGITIAAGTISATGSGGTVTSVSGTTPISVATGTTTPVISLDTDGVTFAFMQEIATDRLIGRDTAATGNPEELTVAGGVEFTGAGGIQRSALTGDVTAPAGSNTTTIPASSIDYAQIQDVTDARVLGRAAGSTGVVQELSAGTGVTISGGTISATGSGGTVTSVSGTAPISVATGTTTPVVSLDNDGVTFAKIQNITTDRLLGRDTAGTGDTEEIPVDTTLEFTGGPGLRRAALTGDVTASAGSNATTIANDTVTHAKYQNIATARVLGRTAAGSGDVEELSAGTGVSISGGTISATGSGGTVTNVTGTAPIAVATGTTTPVVSLNDDGVTFAKMQEIATDRLIGRDTAATGNPEEISLGASLEFSGTASIQRAALTGDVTAAANGNATTIANDAVTYAKIQNVTTARVLGRTTAGSGDIEELSAGTGITIAAGTISASGGAGTVTNVTGTAPISVATGTTTPVVSLDDDGVSNAKLRNSLGLSVIGRDANTTGDPADIQAAAGGAGVLREAGSVLSFGTVATAGITDDAVTFAKFQNITTARLLGRTTAATGNVEEISATTPLLLSALALSVGAATTTAAGIIEISTDGEASATTAVVGTDNRLLTLIDTSQRSVRSVLSSPGVGVPFVAATAYFVYLGRVAKTTTFGFVRWLIRSAASGTQVAECGFFSSPTAPSRVGQTLTKLAATGTLSNLTVTGPASNSTTLAASIPAGTHLWSGIRLNMGTSQGSAYGLLQDQGQGRVLSTAGAAALTGAGPWVGALITDTGIALCAGIEATLD